MANGFTFDGVHSDAFSLIVNKVNIPVTPPFQNRLQEIGGFDGAWDYGISYQPRPIELECSILADSKEDLMNKVEQLAGLLNPRKGAKPLIVDERPNRLYFARLSNQLPLEQIGQYGTFTLEFTCPDPFSYDIDEQTREGVGTIYATQNGTSIAKPVLTVAHLGGYATISNGTELLEFTEDSPVGEYRIDCKEQTATRKLLNETEGRNLAIQNKLSNGYFIDTGEWITSDGGVKTTDYIDVSNTSQIVMQQFEGFQNFRIAQFDANKIFIRRWLSYGVNPYIWAVPDDVAYIRVGCDNSAKMLKIEKGNVATDWSPAPEDQPPVINSGRAYNYVLGDYFNLYPGSNVITTSGGISNVEVRYRNTWL